MYNYNKDYGVMQCHAIDFAIALALALVSLQKFQKLTDSKFDDKSPVQYITVGILLLKQQISLRSLQQQLVEVII